MDGPDPFGRQDLAKVRTRGFSLAESAVDASSNQLRSAAGNLQAPHGIRSDTVSRLTRMAEKAILLQIKEDSPRAN